MFRPEKKIHIPCKIEFASQCLLRRSLQRFRAWFRRHVRRCVHISLLAVGRFLCSYQVSHWKFPSNIMNPKHHHHPPASADSIGPPKVLSIEPLHAIVFYTLYLVWHLIGTFSWTLGTTLRMNPFGNPSQVWEKWGAPLAIGRCPLGVKWQKRGRGWNTCCVTPTCWAFIFLHSSWLCLPFLRAFFIGPFLWTSIRDGQ